MECCCGDASWLERLLGRAVEIAADSNLQEVRCHKVAFLVVFRADCPPLAFYSVLLFYPYRQPACVAPGDTYCCVRLLRISAAMISSNRRILRPVVCEA